MYISRPDLCTREGLLDWLEYFLDEGELMLADEDPRIAPRERWVVLTWDPHICRWEVARQYSHESEHLARTRHKELVAELGPRRVRLLNTADSDA